MLLELIPPSHQNLALNALSCGEVIDGCEFWRQTNGGVGVSLNSVIGWLTALEKRTARTPTVPGDNGRTHSGSKVVLVSPPAAYVHLVNAKLLTQSTNFIVPVAINSVL